MQGRAICQTLPVMRVKLVSFAIHTTQDRMLQKIETLLL